MNLFASDELAGAGLPLWLPDGAVIREQLEQFIVDVEARRRADMARRSTRCNV